MLVPYTLVSAFIVVASHLKMPPAEELKLTPQAGEAGARERQRATEQPSQGPLWVRTQPSTTTPGMFPAVEAMQTSFFSASLGHNVRARGTLDITDPTPTKERWADRWSECWAAGYTSLGIKNSVVQLPVWAILRANMPICSWLQLLLPILAIGWGGEASEVVR